MALQTVNCLISMSLIRFLTALQSQDTFSYNIFLEKSGKILGFKQRSTFGQQISMTLDTAVTSIYNIHVGVHAQCTGKLILIVTR